MIDLRKGALGTLLLAATTFVATSPAFASADEKAALKACEMSLCQMIVNKEAKGDISCKLTKTWGKADLEKGAKATKMKWSWGDARCHTQFDLARAPLVKALSADKYDLKLPATPVNCTIGGGDASKVSFTLAPQLGFEKGEAKTVQLGLDNIKGSFMKRLALKTAQLVDKSHILNGLLTKEVNKFIKEKCPSAVK